MHVNYFDLGTAPGGELRVMVGQVFPGCGVTDFAAYGFEAGKASFWAMKDAECHDDPRVEVRRCAVGEVSGDVKLYHDTAGGTGQGNSIYASKYNVNRNDFEVTPGIRLSDFIAESVPSFGHAINILRFNIEGAEWNVFADLQKHRLLQEFDLVLGSPEGTDLHKIPGLRGSQDGFDRICNAAGVTVETFALRRSGVEKVIGLLKPLVEGKPERRVAYTTITGGYDLLKPRTVDMPGWDFIALTDGTVDDAEGWEIWPTLGPDGDPRRVAKRAKILPHKRFVDYDLSVYIDGSYRIVQDFGPLLDEFLPPEMGWAMPAHCLRQTWEQEAGVIVQRAKDDRKTVKKQVARYRAEELPSTVRLCAGGLLFRRHHRPDVIGACEMWWDEIGRGSVRDQLSWPYVAHKTGIQYNRFPYPYATNDEWFEFWVHGEDMPRKENRKWQELQKSRARRGLPLSSPDA